MQEISWQAEELLVLVVDILLHLKYYVSERGAGSGVVVEALHYKPEGHTFDSRWCHWIF
jgi:hypothetical protein